MVPLRLHGADSLSKILLLDLLLSDYRVYIGLTPVKHDVYAYYFAHAFQGFSRVIYIPYILSLLAYRDP